MNKFLNGVSLIAVGSTIFASSAFAQVDEIIITATKRAESAQDVPVTVQALGEETLDELRVDVFTDYLVQLPGVTAGGSGPGQNTIYVRGLASTTPNLTTAGVAGLAPNVALYLDEQPVSQPGRNLDVYAVDLERVEVLSGPQGTLFGASSQAGTIRLITNKPRLGEFQAKANFGVSFTEGGEMSNKADVTVNLPVSDNFALRGVVYSDQQGGFIDNVQGFRDLSESARYRPEGTVRANGTVVGPNRAGFSSNPAANNINFVAADNSGLVEDDFNDTSYAGFRLSGLYEFNADWNLLVGHSRQRIEADGVFFQDPELDDLEIQRFEEDELEDEYHNTSWTLEGRLGALEALYTGAFTKRDTEQRVDYTDYLFVGQYLPYYICDYYTTYSTSNTATLDGTCHAPNLYVSSVTETEILTQELRFNTPAEHRLRATFGGFYSDMELLERNDFAYPSNQLVDSNNDGVADGYPPNFAQPTAFATSRDAFPADTVFRNDIKRTDEQLGIFGEATFDFNEQFALTVGARYYDIEVDFEGSANASFCNLFSQVDEDAFGTNISDLYDGDGVYTFINSCTDSLRQTYALSSASNTPTGTTVVSSVADIEATGLTTAQATQVFNALNAPDTATTDGVITKVTGTWTPNDDMLFYATYSEGFRPGLLNRPGGAAGPNGFIVPFALDTDDIQNYELGWKTNLADNRLRLNGSLFFVEIENLQTTIFDPSVTNLFFSDNAANAEIAGLEADFDYAPADIQGLTVSGAVSLLDTEITEVLTPTNDVIAGSSLAYAPEFQGNLRARYEWDLDRNDYTAHVQGQVTHSGDAFSDIISINRAEIDSWTELDLSAGVRAENWSAVLFADNVTDNRSELNNNFVFDRERISVTRPRTIGLRFSVEY